jgi:hypothetical protein
MGKKEKEKEKKEEEKKEKEKEGLRWAKCLSEPFFIGKK